MRPHTEITRLHGDARSGLDGVSWREQQAGVEEQRALRSVFLFVGADPETRLEGCNVKVDRRGFVLTGAAAGTEADGFQPAALETSVLGVFAVGDVRGHELRAAEEVVGGIEGQPARTRQVGLQPRVRGTRADDGRAAVGVHIQRRVVQIARHEARGVPSRRADSIFSSAKSPRSIAKVQWMNCKKQLIGRYALRDKYFNHTAPTPRRED